MQAGGDSCSLNSRASVTCANASWSPERSRNVWHQSVRSSGPDCVKCQVGRGLCQYKIERRGRPRSGHPPQNRGEEEQRRGETEDRRNRGEERQTGETSLLSFTGHTLRRSGVELTRPSSPASPASSDCTSPRGETPTVPLLPADQLPAGAPATDLVIRRLLPQLLHLPQLARLVPGLGILVGLVDDEYARVVQRRVLSRTWGRSERRGVATGTGDERKKKNSRMESVGGYSDV